MSAAIAKPTIVDFQSSLSISDEIETFSNIQSVNVLGIVNFIYSIVSIIRKPMHIITISSCLGLSGVASWSAYCASKASLISVTESFRRDPKITKLPIKTTLFCPFFISDSPLFSKYNLKIYWNWIFKPLSVKTVSNSIIKESLRLYPTHQEIWIPWFIYFTPMLRLFPTFMYDYIFEVSCG